MFSTGAKIGSCLVNIPHFSVGSYTHKAFFTGYEATYCWLFDPFEAHQDPCNKELLKAVPGPS